MSQKRSVQWSAAVCLCAASALVAQQNEEASWETWLRRADKQERDHRFAEAAQSAKRALSLAGGLHQTDSPLAIIHAVLGSIYRDWGHCPESRANYARAVAIWEKLSNPDPQNVSNALTRLIGVSLECDDPDAAAKLYRVHYSELQRFYSGPSQGAQLLALQASIARRRNRYTEAEGLLRQALEIMEHTPGAEPANIACLHDVLAADLQNLGRHEESLAEAQIGIALFERIDVRDPPLVDMLNTAGVSLFALGRKEESAQFYQRALALAKEALGEDSGFTAIVMMNYAVTLRSLDRLAEADAMKKEGREVYRRSSLRESQTVDVNVLELGTGNR